MSKIAEQILPLLIRLVPVEPEPETISRFVSGVNELLEGASLHYEAGGRGMALRVDGEELGGFVVSGEASAETWTHLRGAVDGLGTMFVLRRRARSSGWERQEAEAKFRLLAESVPVGLAMTDGAGACAYVNKQWCGISGIAAEEALGYGWARALHPDDRATVLEEWRRCVEAESAFDRRVRYLRPDGSIRQVWVIAMPEYGAGGLLRGYAAVITDLTPLREAEAEAARSAERLEATLEAVEEAVFELNPASGEAYLSGRFQRILGYEAVECRGTMDAWWGLVHPEDLESSQAAMRGIYGEARLFEMECRMRARDGGWRWMRLRGRPLSRDGAGRPERTLGTALDVTERRESEEEYRLILSACFDGFLVLGRDLRFLGVNDAYCRLTGYSRGELLEMSLSDVSMDRPGPARYVAEAGEWQRFETAHRRKDGEAVELEMNLSWSPSGGGRFIGFVRDLTERRRMLEQVRQSEGLYRGLVDNLAGVVFTSTLDGTVTYASPQTERLFGCAPAAWIGRRLEEMVEESHHLRIERQWAQALAEGAAPPVEVRLRCDAEREWSWVAVSLSLQRDEAGAAVSMLGTIWNLTERKEAEERLERSEEQFRSVWESSADGMRLADGTGRVLRVNDAFCRMFGRTREETEGRLLSECYAESEGERILGNFRRKYPGDYAPIFEATVELRNGAEVVLEVSNALIPRPGGPVVLSVFRDVTERRATERRLSVLAQAIEQSPASVMVTDLEGRIEYVNPKFSEVTGYTAEEAIGRNPRMLKSGFVPDSVYNELWRAVRSGGEWHGELLNRRSDGTLFWEQASISAVKNEGGEVTHYVGVKEDITERKRVQEALEESERRFRELLEHVELLALVLDSEMRVRFCNDYFCRVTGWTREQLLGRDGIDLLIPEEQREKMRAGLEAHQENEILAADGRRLLIAWDNTELRGPSGEAAGIASLGRDVTSQRALEEQYRQSQKLESLGRLAGGVAHDFNNLLTVINGYSELMMEELDPLDPVSARAREILRAGLRASELTRQLLAFSRKQMIEVQVVQLNSLLLEVKRMLQRLIGEDIRLELETAPGLGCVEADPGQMHQILMNLAVNARDAMPKGGVLRIETSALALAGEAAAGWDLAPGSYVQLLVGDTGTGMDQETLRHAFEPFFTTKSVDQGTGLGLATVYGIVKQNRGGIRMESRPGVGTTVRILLPVTDKAAAAKGGEVERPAVGREAVLLVEDQPEVRRLVAAILRQYGYDVHETADGVEALKLAGRQQFSLLVSDLVMPNMGGYELAQRVLRVQPEMRVLFMSGYADPQEGETPASLGASFIGKPFSPQALAARVREVLDA